MRGRRALTLLVGILTAFGGFIDIGDLVTDGLVGARFGLALAWVTVVSLAAIMCYCEMAGRIAATTGRAVFDVVRERLSRRSGRMVLVATVAVTGALVMAEMSGAALALQIGTGIDYRWFTVPVAALAFAMATRWHLEWIERSVGGLGLCIVVYVATLVGLHPHASSLAAQAIPRVPAGRSAVEYAFYAVSLIGAQATPYELYFFSSAAVEHEWRLPDHLLDIRSNVLFGFPLGGGVAIAIQAAATIVLLPRGVNVNHLSQSLAPVVAAFGQVGLAVALIGVFAVTMGATMETLFSAAYSAAQSFEWNWGTEEKWHDAPRYHRTLAVVTLAAAALSLSGADPVFVTVVAVVLNAATLPFVMWPLLAAGNDRPSMGRHANGRLSRALGAVTLGLVGVAAAGAIPLLIVTGGT